MPDHVHALISFPTEESIRKVVAAWKHYLAANARLIWQRDFFDHRLRSHESLDEKASYIRANPMRAGLVARAEDWSFVWRPPDIVASPLS
jgi:REP element-mobilizing transposase RayT